jgi:hypothetical protein
MDGYHTGYWTNNYGAYDIWVTVYPPLAFVFLKIFTIKSCYVDGPFAGRTCDWLLLSMLIGFFISNIFIVFGCYQKANKTTSTIRTTALCLGLPMIFALDRGNIIVPCFTCFALGHGRFLRSAKLKWLAVAMSVNLKPYLIGALASFIVRRKWRWFEGAALSVALVYALTWAALGAGSLTELIGNTVAYQDIGGNIPFAASFYSGSYRSLGALIQSVPLMSSVGSRPLEIVEPLPNILIRVGQLGVIMCFAGAVFRPAAVTTHRLSAMIVAMAISSVEVGGYAEVFLIFLVFMERWKGVTVGFALVSAYLLCIPMDHMAISLYHQTKPDYLSNRTIDYDYGLSWGQFMRPGLILIIQYALSIATMLDLARAISPKPIAQGCATPPQLA